MKTAKQHNAEQVGEYSFNPNSNEARIIGGNKAAEDILKVLLEACGWRVVDCVAPKPKRKKK